MRTPRSDVGFCLGVAALVAGLAVARPVRAQSPGESSQIAAPRLDSPPEIAYPKGASGDSAVALVVVVEKAGTVREVIVEKGDEPFASAAREAVLGWRFQPATRDGEPVVARIKFVVTFHPPPPAPPPASSSSSTPPPAAPSKPASPPTGIEVVIHAEKAPPSVTTFSRAEVRQLPGAFGDPFRAIEALPGVTPIVSGLPYFYVRGAPPGNVGYFLDGVRVPYLFHVAVGPSVVNPAMVEEVNLYSGGYPAQFGRFAGAIVTAETTAPRDDFHGEGNIRLFDAGAIVEAGFAGGKGTVLLGGRYSYTAALFSIISPTNRLDYRDYQARITYDVTPRDRIGLFAFGAYDLLSQQQNGIDSIVFGSEFYRFDLRYEHRLPDNGLIRWASTWGFDQTRVGEQRNARDTLYGTRVDLRQPLGRDVTLRAGADAQFDDYRADPSRYTDPEDPNTIAYNNLFPQRTDSALGAYADVVWRMARRIQVTPGVRFDMFRSGGASALGVDPRLAVRTDVTDHVRILHALGIAHQPPSFIIPLPGVAVGTLGAGLQTAIQASAGVEVELPEATTATATFFDNVFLDMSDTLSLSATRNATTSETRSLGSAYGLEVYVRRRLTRRLGGFLSYTLSRSLRRLGAETFPSAFDRTHVLNAAVAYDLGRNWRIGTRFTFYTGAPVLGFQNGLTPADREHPARDPNFYRIDWRLEKRWVLAKSRWVSFVAEFMNATLHKEVINGQSVGPISIPSLGVEGGL